MPNWCSNYMRITSDSEKRTEDLDTVLAAILDEARQFDLGSITPMPAIMMAVSTGGNKIDGKPVSYWISEQVDGKTVDRVLSPTEQAEVDSIGFPSWYEWSIHNWGTKWNASGTEVDENFKEYGQVELRYQTAWSPPVPVLAALREKFPDIEFEFRFRNEDDHEFPHEVEA